MSKKITCVACAKYLGEIKDGRIRKGTVYLCDNCNTKRLAADMMEKNDPLGSLKKSMMDKNPNAKFKFS